MFMRGVFCCVWFYFWGFFSICLHQFGLVVSSFICRIRKHVIIFSGSAIFMSWHARSNEIEKYKLRSIKERFIYVFFVAALQIKESLLWFFFCYWNEGIH